ncbi:hypothetical protein ZYGR_0H01030 [Zygosaccharomyces rouxii]|uniref:ZYRO0B06314p n=2 Tax=Zygosaccharomyces rouxii TaxID=4956 RepID=C5DR83_ZYGRC|nr:uncharacterized protein ZYRO0B06314g [Zygosaccharomyces rouxii]KAH9200161.1 YL1 nuclear protein-domain-containing protein [Zygosaccharomyces rouxii]GAV47262.1 hypothetical protein ZYGR_0H01030 [Zygosaccharomyces rouxii]CAR26294.1 ZYRO0B06314p [Zygosaccharomyces rouxii]
MSDDDLDLNEEEFLMSTRQRRSNAGNKMKKLLEQELEDMQSRTERLEEDEVDLLFKEEGDDEDFESEASGDNENEFGQNLEETGGGDADEMFSESEEEPGDQEEDNEEGEKNLRRQEKLESRKRKRRTPAVIKRKRPKSDTEDVAAKQEQEEKKKAQYEQIKAETLLITNRRTSQRSSVVANKLKVYEKLSKAEKKRKVIQDRIKKHKESQKEEILTQEDRIRIALETEKFNILSLDKYKEQEISKKQSRIALQQRQKMKFKPGETVLRQLSCTWQVTPANEIEDAKYWEEQLKRREKKTRRYTRRPHKKKNLDPKEEENGVKVKEEVHEESALKDTNDTGSQLQVATSITTPLEPNEKVSMQPREEKESVKPVQGTETLTEEGEKDKSVATNTEDDNMEKKSTKEPSPPLNESNSENASGEQRGSDTQSTPEDGSSLKLEEDIQAMREEKKTELTADEIKEATPPQSANEVEAPSEREKLSTATISKQVQFVDEPQVNIIDSSDRPLSASPNMPSPTDTTHDKPTPDLIEDAGSEEELVFEGPEQLVGKNFITLYSFPTESYRNDINKELFGENWANGSSHRSSDVETVCKLTMPEGKIDVLEDTSLAPNLSFLNNFPAFGEYDKKVVHDVDSTANKEHEIEVKTAPPTGVFLPNGFRKKCLISSKECQYFDPKNGVPYSDVETYKTIQDLQDPIGSGTEEEPGPHYRWFGFGNGGIYLDVGQKPAKGVPDGF